jgi:hypothetical protein
MSLLKGRLRSKRWKRSRSLRAYTIKRDSGTSPHLGMGTGRLVLYALQIDSFMVVLVALSSVLKATCSMLTHNLSDSLAAQARLKIEESMKAHI